MSKLVSTVIKDRICYIEMQNADHFNCLSEEMCHELIDSLQYGYKQECVGIVIKAQCKKGVWSAGHDIRELPQDGSDPLAYDVPMEKLLRKVQETPIPVIACVSGSVWGGACDLCLSCDMIVRTPLQQHSPSRLRKSVFPTMPRVSCISSTNWD